MTEWTNTTVAHLIAEGVLERPMDGNHGAIHPKTSDFVEKGIPFIMASDMKNNRVDLENCSHISVKQAHSLRKGFAKTGDVLLSHKATIGRTAIVGEIDTPFIMLTPQVTYYRILRPEVLDRRYLSYYFRSREFRHVFEQWAGAGSTRAYIGITDQKRLPINFPDIETQRSIARFVGALDDKIELNRRMSATLEEMARALYCSWFVDFDPVHARALGQPPAHMDPTTAALFPDSFGEDGLPEGWEWNFFDEYYATLETGKRPKGGVSSISEGVPSIGAESIKKIGYFDFAKTKFVPREYFASMRKGHLQEGDILIYKDGGKPGELRPAATYISKGFPYSEACINEHVFRIRFTDKIGQYFGFLAISSDHCMNQMRELATGVAQPGLNQTAMKALSFILPNDPALVQQFEKIVAPILDGCNESARESQTLAAHRDALLPRLISGELRIREAEKQVEDVV